ncbi:hypothetical protein D9M70_600600 [compost metagenome]
MAALRVETQLIAHPDDVGARQLDDGEIRAHQFGQGFQSPQCLDLGVRVGPGLTGKLELYVTLDQGAKA